MYYDTDGIRTVQLNSQAVDENEQGVTRGLVTFLFLWLFYPSSSGPLKIDHASYSMTAEKRRVDLTQLRVRKTASLPASSSFGWTPPTSGRSGRRQSHSRLTDGPPETWTGSGLVTQHGDSRQILFDILSLPYLAT